MNARGKKREKGLAIEKKGALEKKLCGPVTEGSCGGKKLVLKVSWEAKEGGKNLAAGNWEGGKG